MLKINVRFSWIRIWFTKNSILTVASVFGQFSSRHQYSLYYIDLCAWSWYFEDGNPKNKFSKFCSTSGRTSGKILGEYFFRKTTPLLTKITVSESLEGFLLQSTTCQKEQICSSDSEIIERYSPSWVGWKMRCPKCWNRSSNKFRISKETKYFWWTWRRI